MKLTVLAAAAMGGVVALVGFAGAANASATVDLIWIDKTDIACTDPGRRDCPRLGTTISSVAATDNITLGVIITAGPLGIQGAEVSVNYGNAMPVLSVSGFQNLTTTLPLPYLPYLSNDAFGSPPFVDNIGALSIPQANLGIGLPPGSTAYLGTVSFHKGQPINGTFEIAVSTEGRSWTGGVVAPDPEPFGKDITATTTFNSAFLIDHFDPPSCDFEIEVNQIRAGGKTVWVGTSLTVDVSAKARILKGTALPGTTIDTVLTIEARDDTGVLDTEMSLPITLGVGKGGTGDKLTLNTTRCDGGFITFVATFSGNGANGAVCEGTRTIRKECK